MRKITEKAVSAFNAGRRFCEGNTIVDGAMYLHGNKIAWFDHQGKLWITTAGWNTLTTRERLNGLTGVNVRMYKGQLFLNDQKWSGEPTEIHRDRLAERSTLTILT